MATEHANISDPQVHEPKGASTASAGQVYVANGAGSGAWSSLPLTMGVYDYNDLATATTPVAMTSASTDYELTNDGLGPFTNTTYGLTGIDDVWDTGTNKFDFTELSLGDTVDVRLDVEWTSVGANQIIEISIELAVGASPYKINFVNSHVEKTAGAHRFTVWQSVYMGDSNTLDNPARIVAQSDSAGTSMKVNGWYTKVLHRG